MTRQEFKTKWLDNAFYWVNIDNYLLLQDIFQEFGIKSHTGEGVINCHKGFNNLLTFPPDKWHDYEYYQKTDCWYPNARYGAAKDYKEMLLDYSELTDPDELKRLNDK